MKKIMMLFAVVVGSLCITAVNGQTAFGLKGGVNIANLTDNTYKPRVSAHGGIFVHHTLNKNFCIQPELLFSGEGQRFVYNGSEHTWALDYLQIPLMLQVYPVKEVYLEAGPQVGFLLSAKDKITNGGHANLKADIASVQFSIGAGLGVKVTNEVIIYGRYNFGFTDITTYDAIIHHSHVGQVGLAYRFHK